MSDFSQSRAARVAALLGTRVLVRIDANAAYCAVITDVREAFGRVDVACEPVDGYGLVWRAIDSVRTMERGSVTI